MSERLDKFLSNRAGLTRSEARDVIRRGGCTVNGTAVRQPEQKVDPDSDRIELNGQPIGGERYSYIMLHKPAGVVSATEDPKERTVLDLLPEDLRRRGQFPAGRLDKDTEGFVLITDDGAFAHRILAPKSHVPKTYEAILDAPVDESDIRAFAEGLRIGEDMTRSAELEVLIPGEQPRVRVVLTQGLYHQIKRMFAARGKKVLYLKRTHIGPIPLDPALEKGEARPLTAKEKEILGAE